MPQRTVAGQHLVRLAEVRSVNPEARTVDLVFTTGHKGKRTGWLGDEWFEELEVSDKAMRLDRLNAGAPLLNTHGTWSLDDVVGVIEKARVENGLGVATVRFSKREDVEPIFRDVQDGIIRNVSVGYRVHKWQDVTEGDDKIKTYRAVDWEPMEVSLVPIGFDPGAQTRSAAVEPFTTEIISARAADNEGEKRMDPDKNPQPGTRAEVPAPAAPAVDLEAAKREAAEKAKLEERQRCDEIRSMVSKHKLDDALATELIRKDTSVADARAFVLEALAKRDLATNTQSGTRFEAGATDAEKRGLAVENALMHRGLGEHRVKLSDDGRAFRGLNLLEIGRRWLETQGHRTESWDKYRLAGELFRRTGMHGTSDFSYVLANVATKSLMAGYDQASALQTFAPFVKRGSLPDFKEAKRAQAGEAPNLVAVPENGEITEGTIANRGEAIQLSQFGRIFSITTQALINDDLGAFTDMPSKFGAAAARLESDKVYAVITANAAMSDGENLFDTDHASGSNLKSSGGAIDVTSLAYGFQLLAQQKGVNDQDYLNIVPKFLVVPPAIAAVAMQYVSVITPNGASSVNPYAGRLEVITEARLGASDANAWYLIANPAEGWDTIELATLDGARGPRVDTESGFDVDGLRIRAIHACAAKALEWRTMFKNDGGS